MPKKRAYDGDFKFNVVMQIIAGDMTVAQASRHYRIKDSLLYAWKAHVLETGGTLFDKGNQQQKRDAQKIAALERKVGQLTMDYDIVKKATWRLNRPYCESAS